MPKARRTPKPNPQQTKQTAKKGPAAHSSHQQKSSNQNKNVQTTTKKNESPPPDKLVGFIEHFLGFWKEEYPNLKFWNDLLNIMMPMKALDNSQLSAVMADFSAAMREQTNFFKFHPFGSTVTGLAFQGM